MSETNNEQNSLADISETLADQSFRVINFWNRLQVAEIRLRQTGQEASPVRSDIQDIRLSVNSLLDPILTGIDMRTKLAEIDSSIQRIEEELTA